MVEKGEGQRLFDAYQARMKRRQFNCGTNGGGRTQTGKRHKDQERTSGDENLLKRNGT